MNSITNIVAAAIATLVFALVNAWFLMWYGVIILVLICFGVGIGKVFIDILFGG